MRHMKKLLALVLVFCTMLSICTIPASAATIADGSKTCSVALAPVHNYLQTTAGTWLRAGGYDYTTNDNITGPAYCIDHGLSFTDKVLPITGKYNANPKVAGVFANGYPQFSVDMFLDLNLEHNAILAGLTEYEFRYATQVAVWAALGQLGVDGTQFTSGREYLNPPTGDVQQARVFRTVQLLLATGANWDRVYQTGMYIRLEDNALGGDITIDPHMTLDYAAKNGEDGIKCEVINGKSYFTREYIFASATSTYWNDYSMELWAEGCPAGTMFVDLSNQELPRSSWRETATWRCPTEYRGTNLNGNGFEYYCKAKLCIPVDTVPPSGKITLRCAAKIMQYELYLANNETASEQSYIIADPSKGTKEAQALLSWGGPDTKEGYLRLIKMGSGNSPLAGATFTLTGTDGKVFTGTTDEDGIIFWSGLNPHAVYTLEESAPPPGYRAIEPMILTVNAAEVKHVPLRNDTEHSLIIRKVDRQNGYSLQGVTMCFEQVDGSYKTTAVTDHAGLIRMDANKLPVGVYKIYEVATRPGYDLDPTPQTVNWDGTRDVTLMFENTRQPTLIIGKIDSYTHYSLPGASFKVYKDGALVTTVTTDDNGLAYVHGITSGYWEIRESVVPAGYVKDKTVHGINIDLYDPASEEDPRLVIENDPMPGLKIIKYDRQSMKPLADATFKVYKDTTLIGSYTTDRFGEISLPGLEPGTYLVQEENVSGTHLVDTTPQQVKLEAGRKEAVVLTFFNDRRPGMRLIKVDAADPGKTIAGAVFEIKAVNGSFGPKEYTTDRNGEIDLSALPTGAFLVTEKSCPGYVVDDAQRIIELKPNEDTRLFPLRGWRRPCDPMG